MATVPSSIVHERHIVELPAPSGWFAVARASELPPGRVLTTTLAGEELVVFRTASGAVGATEPWCPHLGAHLGHAGQIAGDTLRCTFHGFCFDTDGRCTATAYGTKPPAGATLSTRSARVANGVVLVHHSAARVAPSWAPPVLPEEGWTPFTFRTYRLAGHPQETTENSVDLGHLSVVHGYHDVEVVEPLQIDGPVLRSTYRMQRPFRVPGLGRRGINAQFAVEVHGLGWSLVELTLPSLGLRARQLVLATPTTPGQMVLRIALSVRELRPATGALTRPAMRTASRLAAEIAMIPFAHDVRQDFRIWRHKAHVSRPALADGDGPIGRYRTWAKQFYAAPA